MHCSASAVTKLMALNMAANRNVVWDDAAMDSRINIAMQVSCLGARAAGSEDSTSSWLPAHNVLTLCVVSMLARAHARRRTP
jgi:hypothetical protein